MTSFQWITFVQSLVMALAAAGVALLYRGFRTGQWAQQIGEGRNTEIAAINRRLDKAGEKQSDLANMVQVLRDEMRGEMRTLCVSREVFEIERAVAAEQRRELRDEFRRELNKVWDELRARRRL